MKKKIIAKGVAGLLTVSALMIMQSSDVYAEVAYDSTKGFHVENSAADVLNEDSSSDDSVKDDDRMFIKRIPYNDPDDWRQRITQKRQEVLELNNKTVEDTARMIEELNENGKTVLIRKETVFSKDKEQYVVRKRVKNDELRLNAQYEQDMENIREAYWAEKDDIRQEKLLHHRQLRKEHLVSKAENKHERQLAKLDQKLALDNEKWQYEQSKNRVRVDQKIDNRYFLIGKDNVFTYYLEILDSGWISVNERRSGESVNQTVLDAWIRMVENSELEKAGKHPQKYYLEHYYMDSASKRIQFLCEMEVSKGRPDNTVKQRGYAPNQWEELVPGSIEDELYHRVISNVSLSKIVSQKEKVKPKKKEKSDSSATIDFMGIYW